MSGDTQRLEILTLYSKGHPADQVANQLGLPLEIVERALRKPQAMHPIGHSAARGQDQRTPANRDALGTCLYAYYAGDLGEQINKRSNSATGRELAAKMVTRLELASALEWLYRHHRDWLVLIELRYARRWSYAKVALAAHKAKETVTKEIERGLDVMVERIWADPDGR